MDSWLYRHKFLVLVLLEALLNVCVLVPAMGAYTTVHPSRNPIIASAKELNPNIEPVSMTTADDIKIQGWYFPSKNGAEVIALHGHSANRLGVVPHTKILEDSGFCILAIDLRAHGESGGERYTDCNAAGDVLIALDYLQLLPMSILIESVSSVSPQVLMSPCVLPPNRRLIKPCF